MDETQPREVAAVGGIPVRPGMGEHEPREAVRASNTARAAGMPSTACPVSPRKRPTTWPGGFSGAPAPPDEPE